MEVYGGVWRCTEVYGGVQYGGVRRCTVWRCTVWRCMEVYGGVQYGGVWRCKTLYRNTIERVMRKGRWMWGEEDEGEER